MQLNPEQLELLRALCLGFAFSGLLASAFEWLADRPAGMRLLERGGVRGLASVPLLVFAAPALIVRAVVRGRKLDRRPVAAVVVATAVAGFWSLMCGRVILDAALLLLPA